MKRVTIPTFRSSWACGSGQNHRTPPNDTYRKGKKKDPEKAPGPKTKLCGGVLR